LVIDDRVVNHRLTCEDTRIRRSAAIASLEVRREFSVNRGVSGVDTPGR
jgi:hypothetical protein